MPSGKYLSIEERAKIDAWRDPRNAQVLSMGEIGRRLHRSTKVVSNYIAKGNNYGVKKKTKGTTKITRRQKNCILHEAIKNRMNASEIKDKLQLPITSKHVNTILRTSGQVKWRKSIKKPVLKPHHKHARLRFAKNHMSWSTQWDQVIFSDEKKFNLDGPDCCSYYWHGLKEEDDPKPSRNFGGGSVMVWSAFSARGRAPICFISTRTNSERYVTMMDDVLIQYLEDVMDGDAIFQQDNASIHTARNTMAWFADRGIPVLEWPAISPDLNPIENLWAILARRVYGKPSEKRVFNSAQELKTKIVQEWDGIQSEIIQSLITSMPNRIYEVILKQGGSTHY